MAHTTPYKGQVGAWYEGEVMPYGNSIAAHGVVWDEDGHQLANVTLTFTLDWYNPTYGYWAPYKSKQCSHYSDGLSMWQDNWTCWGYGPGDADRAVHFTGLPAGYYRVRLTLSGTMMTPGHTFVPVQAVVSSPITVYGGTTPSSGEDEQ